MGNEVKVSENVFNVMGIYDNVKKKLRKVLICWIKFNSKERMKAFKTRII